MRGGGAGAGSGEGIGSASATGSAGATEEEDDAEDEGDIVKRATGCGATVGSQDEVVGGLTGASSGGMHPESAEMEANVARTTRIFTKSTPEISHLP